MRQHRAPSEPSSLALSAGISEAKARTMSPVRPAAGVGGFYLGVIHFAT
ncbi:MAG: hypothetical protein WBZ11_22495 [Candidatus Sulfotelmatobacter sp.]